jgi:hypothetical protein
MKKEKGKDGREEEREGKKERKYNENNYFDCVSLNPSVYSDS